MAIVYRLPLRSRFDTEDRWEEVNPVLRLGELGYCRRDDGSITHKCGDGEAHWVDLPWVSIGEEIHIPEVMADEATITYEGKVLALTDIIKNVLAKVDTPEGVSKAITDALADLEIPEAAIDVDEETITTNRFNQLCLTQAARSVLDSVDTGGSVKAAIAAAVADIEIGGVVTDSAVLKFSDVGELTFTDGVKTTLGYVDTGGSVSAAIAEAVAAVEPGGGGGRPDVDTANIVYDGQDRLTLSDANKATLSKVDTPGSVSAAIAALMLESTTTVELTQYNNTGTYTWVAPDINSGANYEVVVEIKGGGGGGGYYQQSPSRKGGGGGEGGHVVLKTTVTPNAPYNLVVGVGGEPTTGATGNSGGTSSAFGITATGGGGGARTAAGGLGGTSAATDYIIKITGSSGATASGDVGGKGGGNHGGAGAYTTTPSVDGTAGCGGGGGFNNSYGGSRGGDGYIIIRTVV